MAQRPKRERVDLSAYPQLVVIYLGMWVNTITGVKTLSVLDQRSQAQWHPSRTACFCMRTSYSLRHVGMRQYWRDFESLERWARSEPHRLWWEGFLRDSGGAGFWHETYFRAAASKRYTWTWRRPSA
jgi:hypothetical protein